MAAGQAPFEKVEPVNPAGSFTVRALTAVTVNPTTNSAYLAASSAVSTASARPSLFQYLNQNGGLNIGGMWVGPTGAGSWFEVHNVTQTPSGGFVASGRSFGGGVAGTGTSVVLLDANLNHLANREPSGVDLTAPNSKVLALPTGEIVQMINRPTQAGQPSAALWFYTANLSNVTHVFGYSTGLCEHLRFTDMAVSGQTLYVAGYKLHPTVAGATQSILLEVSVDPTIPATFGLATGMWTFPDFPAGMAESRFTAIALQPGSSLGVWLVGQYNDITQPIVIAFSRALKFVPVSASKPVDVNMVPRTVVPAGGAFLAPNGNCGLGFYLERLHVTGASIDSLVGRHYRLDAYTGQVATAWEYGNGGAPFHRFYAQVPTTGGPDSTIMGGSYRATGASLYDPLFVKTNCEGKTSCATPYALTTAPFGGAVQVDTPVTKSGWTLCNGGFGGVPSLTSRSFAASPMVVNVTVSICAGCTGDVSGDDEVGGADLGMLLGSWGACTGDCQMDLDGDGMVGGSDLGQMLALWGPCSG